MAVRFPVTPQPADTVEIENKYSNTSHLTQVGKYGEDPGDLSFPRGVAIHENSNNIYVTEYNPGRVSIFSEFGEFLNSFSHEKMKRPCGIAIRHNSLYVSNVVGDYGVFCFKIESDIRLHPTLVCMGYDEGTFSYPHQLAISDQGEVFVADCWIQKVQILDETLHFKRSIKHDSMQHPRDVKPTNTEVFVLTESSPCVFVFSHAGEKLRSFITRGEGMQVTNPLFFCLDAGNNLFISDYGARCVKIFSPDAKVNHFIKVVDVRKSGPQGIALTKQYKLFLIARTEPFQLQLYSYSF